MKRSIFPLFACIALCFASCGSRRVAQEMQRIHPKHEFRAAWLPTVFRSEYASGDMYQTQALLRKRIEALHRIGCNAVIFQIRPESDAFYVSRLEPWSRFLTGKQGQPPAQRWDPLTFVTDLCHSLGMELHAWINPYRAATSTSNTLAPQHPYYQHPEWFVRYNGQLLYDPGQPEVRAYICRIVRDVVMRYDIDAIHLDDYFYPYPVPGLRFPDDASFDRYGRQAGYADAARGDWRRRNVDQLVSSIKTTLLGTKPWVRLGISPFGIYRNSRSTPDGSGSRTSGLQAYDELYADVLLWQRKGWVDYIAPQLYWPFGHKAADYGELSMWWSRQANARTHIYYGIDVKRTMQEGQLERKLLRNRALVQGTIYWPAEELVANCQGVMDSLRSVTNKYPALIPPYTAIYRGTPDKVRDLRAEWEPNGYYLRWKDMADALDPVRPQFYVVYAFASHRSIDREDASAIVYYGPASSYKMPYHNGQMKYTYLVTAVDRFRHESKPAKIKVKL